ncbi:MAG: ATP-binding protein [Lewinellaceae bacterium]|nr:ATP-binding protein [Lewinellaceae bacterium]
MEGVLFIGIQASGKSTFYKERFFNSHMRISLDLLNTRNKENQLLEKCLELQQRVVIDNTNPTVGDRRKYIEKFRQYKYKIVGYYFQSKIEDAVGRNQNRTAKQKIPEKGIRSTYSKLELPSREEGFDELYYVEIKNGQFIINEWQDEI